MVKKLFKKKRELKFLTLYNRLAGRKLLFITFIFLSTSLFAQDFPCTYWPAPCPNTTSLEQADDGPQRKQNGAIDQTLAFTRKMQNELTSLMLKTANQNGWRVYELMEDVFDGPPFIFVSYDAWEKTPYEKRPPITDDITFIIIVNKDSLRQWKNWRVQLQSESENQVSSYVTQTKSVEDDNLLKAYFDSAQYYTKQFTDYSQAHEKQYLEDLKNNNQKALEQYERNTTSFTNKSDAYIKKYQDRQALLFESSGKSFNSFENNMAKLTAAFNEGSIVLIHFAINPYQVKTGMEDGSQRSLNPQYSLKVPGASYAGLLVNKKAPDDHAYKFNYKGYLFNSPAAIATILFGNYQPKDSYNNYRPMFEKTFTSAANTIGSVKNIKCDVLQNLTLHLEGGKNNVINVINHFDWSAIKEMLGK
ncbi:MAG TPA: hypothetical protein VLS85_02470 [Hanamia sp.]|nr:hypothetical protein [Hanamia sp.]